MKNNLQGTGVALITPFTTADEVDYPALERVITHVTDGGADYLVVLGTTGETSTLSADEKHRVVEFVKQKNADRLPIVLGAGGNNTGEVIRSFSRFDMNGITAILSIAPYYNKPNQAGLYEHFKAIALEAPRPVVLYNVPSRTGINLCAETTLRLAHDFENVAAIKEASGSLSQINYILRDKPDNFMVISGDDNMALPVIALGGDGVISVAANAFPEPVCRMVKLCLAGDFGGASMIQMSLIEMVDSLFEEGSPVGIKCALTLKGIIDNNLRLPLVAGSEKLEARITALMKKYEL